jgi:hypothetical protein
MSKAAVVAVATLVHNLVGCALVVSQAIEPGVPISGIPLSDRLQRASQSWVSRCCADLRVLPS